MEVIKKLWSILKEIEKKERKIKFREKVIWKEIKLLILIVCWKIKIFGIMS
jgi:hypothetical protein